MKMLLQGLEDIEHVPLIWLIFQRGMARELSLLTPIQARRAQMPKTDLGSRVRHYPKIATGVAAKTLKYPSLW